MAQDKRYREYVDALPVVPDEEVGLRTIEGHAVSRSDSNLHLAVVSPMHFSRSWMKTFRRLSMPATLADRASTFSLLMLLPAAGFTLGG